MSETLVIVDSSFKIKNYQDFSKPSEYQIVISCKDLQILNSLAKVIKTDDNISKVTLSKVTLKDCLFLTEVNFCDNNLKELLLDNTKPVKIILSNNNLKSFLLYPECQECVINNNYSKLTEFSIPDNSLLETLSLHKTNISNLLDISKCPKLTNLDYGDTEIVIDLESLYQDLHILDCSWTPTKCVPANNFKNLTQLSCVGLNLTNLDVSNCQLLKVLRCGDNNLEILDVSNLSLNYLSCRNNPLTTIIGLKTVKHLNCSNTLIQELNLVYTSTKIIQCSNCKLTSLSLGKDLKQLYCCCNNLLELDLSASVCVKVFCTQNPLKKIIVHSNQELDAFEFYSNLNIIKKSC